MDFHSLSRRELQALCKRNKIPANVTNVAMADSLKALQIVDGIDEVLQACKSETSQSSIEPRAMSEVTSPYVPPTGGRSTMQKDVLLTPAQSGVTSRRRRAAKEASAVKQVYGTRRSARLAEKSAKLLRGVTEFSKKDLFTGDGQDFQMNLEESLDGSDEVSGVTGISQPEKIDEGHVDSAHKQDISTDVELSLTSEVAVISHSEHDGPQSELKEGVDANTPVDVNFEATDKSEPEVVELVLKSEEEHHSSVDGSQSKLEEGVDANTPVEVNFEATDESETEGVKLAPEFDERHSTVDIEIDLNENAGAEIEQVGSGSKTEEFFNFDDTKASCDEVLSQALNLINETPQADGLDDVQTSETKTRVKAEKIEEEKTAEDPESVDETENEDDSVIAEESSDIVIQSDDQIFIEVDSNPDEVTAFDDIEEYMELNADSSETESNSGESDSDNLDLEEDSMKSHDSLASEISLMSDFNWDVAASLEASSTPQLAAVAPNNITTAFAIPSMRITVAAASDNKENIISSGSKTAHAKERSKIAETVPTLDDPSLMKLLSKDLKELAITQNLDNNEAGNGASARTALQVLPDNQKAN